MPTFGRTLREAARAHQQHLNSLLASTITLTPIRARFIDGNVNGARKPVVSLEFQNPQGGTGHAILQTQYGPIAFSIGQLCDAVEVPDSNQIWLRTIAYRYALRPLEMDNQLIRWEYVRFPGDDARWCLHHVQGLINFGFPATRNTHYQINLNDWHLPTGRVDIEDVIRFCLHDLGARSLSGNWHETLLASPAPA